MEIKVFFIALSRILSIFTPEILQIMNLKSIFYQIPKIFPMSFDSLMNRNSVPLIAPFYHTVSDIPLPHCKHILSVKSVAQFENDLEYLLRHYTPIGVSELLQHLSDEKPLLKPSFFLTFDDGLSQFYDIIAPVLLRKGIPAVFFVNTAFIENKAIFYRFKISLLIEAVQQKRIPNSRMLHLQKLLQNENKRYKTLSDLLDLRFHNEPLLDELATVLDCDFTSFLKQEKPYLSMEQVDSLIKQGFEVGSHSVDHPLYFSVSPEEQIRQTIAGVEFINNTFHVPYRLFSFPFTDEFLSLDFFGKISPHIDISFGTAGLKQDMVPTNIQRISMEVPGMTAQQILKAEYLYYTFKKLFHKNLIRRK